MDMERFTTREQLNRMVWNYHLLGKIEKGTAEKIMGYIDLQIGGGYLEREAGGRVILFPQKDGPYQRPQRVDTRAEPEKIEKEFENVLRAKNLYLFGMDSDFPKIGIKTLADCCDTSIEKLKKLRGVGDKKALKMYEALKGAYDEMVLA
jgi:hypothetical protein